MTTATMEPKTKTTVAPFGIEADHPRNGDLLLQSVPGCRLRSAISASKHVIDAKTGEPKVPQDQARHLGQLPPIPGMQIHVSPAKLTYMVIDPLHDDEELCERIRKTLDQISPFRMGRTLKGVPPLKGVLDKHRMKTLCRELVWLVDASEAKAVKGTMPELDEVDKLEGEYLLNPGSQVTNMQPRFECDWDKWLAELTRSGG